MADKNYVVSSIKKVTTQYGDLFNASFKGFLFLPLYI